MLYKMNSFCLDCFSECPNAQCDEMIICQLAWNGQFIFVQNLNKFYELEDMQLDLFKKNEKLSVETIDKYLGLDSVPYGEKNLFFSQSNMLEFTVLPMKYNGREIYKVSFLSLPDCLPSNKKENEKPCKKEVHNLKVHEVLIELEDLKNFIHDNFYDTYDTSVVLDHLDKIYEDVSNLEVK